MPNLASSLAVAFMHILYQLSRAMAVTLIATPLLLLTTSTFITVPFPRHRIAVQVLMVRGTRGAPSLTATVARTTHTHWKIAAARLAEWVHIRQLRVRRATPPA